jgi:hypothetical protein
VVLPAAPRIRSSIALLHPGVVEREQRRDAQMRIDLKQEPLP